MFWKKQRKAKENKCFGRKIKETLKKTNALDKKQRKAQENQFF